MAWYSKDSKFGNIQKNYGGRTFHSSLEADYAAQLDLLQQAGEIQSWQSQPSFRLEVNGHHITTIIPDFLVIGKHGREEIHEVKGGFATQTDVWRVKWKLLQALYPEYKYEVITRKNIRR